MVDIVGGNEVGHGGGIQVDYDWKGNQFYTPAPAETTRELLWPQSVYVYDQMRNDSQVTGILGAIFLPIMAASWTLDTSGVDEKVVKFVRHQVGLNLTKTEARQRRRKEGIVFKDHLRVALLSAVYGHMPFEQVYEVKRPEPGREDYGLKAIAHLRKLAPRFPRTLKSIHVAPDGGLVGITQEPVDNTGVRGYQPKFIGVEQLVYYCHQREGGDWTGRSILRSAYKHWMIRDVMIRLAAQIVERNGMGVPDMTYDGNEATREDALKAVREFRAGATAGMVRKVGTTFELKGVTGSTVDPLPHIAAHDQSIAKSALAMFIDLGHDTGARSLGETFVDFFTASLQDLADEVAETFTEHVIRDLVEANFGADEPYPTLTPGRLAEQQAVSAETLSQLTNGGLITPDGKLEGHLRDRYGLPPVDMASRPQPVAAAPPAEGESRPFGNPKAAPKPGDNVTAIRQAQKTAASAAKPPGVLKDGTPPLCHYCKERAGQYVLHSEGMAYIPACDEHLQRAKTDAAESVPGGEPDPTNINRVATYASAGPTDYLARARELMAIIEASHVREL